MNLFDKLRQGMHVFGPDDRSVGTIDRWDDDNIYIGGRSYPRSLFDRFDNDRLYFSNEGYRSYQSHGMTGQAQGMTSDVAGYGRTEGEIRVPVVEERLEVGKQATELGAVEIRKEVVAEQQSIPVELRREEVHVQRVDVPDRPITAGDFPNAFEEGTIRVPVRGEEAFATKEAVVTGEVVINKEQVAETQTVTDTVRREVVDVDENYMQQRDRFRDHFEQRQAGLTGTAVDTRTFDDAEPNYRTGFTAAYDERYAGRQFEDVEPDLRRDYTSQGTTGSGDAWEHLREEIREGWNRARGNH